MPITLGDLKSVVDVIDVCSKRGAFEGQELKFIGELRTKYADEISLIEKNLEATDDPQYEDKVEESEEAPVE
jgi:hypothetical protein